MPKLLGLIGGLGPYSTILYYKMIVEEYHSRVGEHPRLVLYSVPVQRMCRLMSRGMLDEAGKLLEEALEALARAGASIVALAANTPHAALRLVEPPGGVEIVDIVDPVLERLKELGAGTVGLLATGATVRYRVYHDPLEEAGFRVVTPRREGQELLDSIVSRAVEGDVRSGDARAIEALVGELAEAGAEAVIYGCTELALYKDMLSPGLPVVDSLEEHVRGIVSGMLG